MNDDQKWLEAAAGIQEDIHYVEMALRAAGKRAAHTDLEINIQYLKVALAVYRNNAATGTPWPSPDDLYCIQPHPCGTQQFSTGTRRGFKTAC